ncbi:hypothetical protein [Brevundimonas diminuta]|jgi:hypothetical protein|uniref:hypothetical protein n=1 Tax=Brevundimonas diminuta TaxID=293 RepID=UPI003D9A6957
MSSLKPHLVPDEWRAIINPWTPDADLARVLILRAAILWSYSHVEQKLTDIAIRCSRIPEYRDISEKPPFTPASRIKFLRKVMDTPGPFTPIRRLGLAVLDRFDDGRAVRNRMAHADMSIIGYPIRFEEIVISGDEITRHDTPYYRGDLEQIAVKAARFSKAVQRLHYKAFGNEPISQA